jgi:hypothetical protein
MRLRQYLISAFFHRPVTPNMRVILLAQSYFTTYRVIQLVWPPLSRKTYCTNQIWSDENKRDGYFSYLILHQMLQIKQIYLM